MIDSKMKAISVIEDYYAERFKYYKEVGEDDIKAEKLTKIDVYSIFESVVVKRTIKLVMEDRQLGKGKLK